jgi:predicted unusual protein kinase regulating ubiquinone biosynthesis (AarF/ABC1/UbiB family)
MDSPTISRLCSLVIRTVNLGVNIAHKGANIAYKGANIAYKGANIAYKSCINKPVSFARNVWFLLNVCSIVGLEYTCYLLGRKRIDCLKNVSNKIYNANKFSIKLFQVLSSSVDVFTEEEISYLKVYTDNSPYTSNDIDKTFLTTLEEIGKSNPDYMITLENDINYPSHSGMVSLVYKGRMNNGKSIVVKVLRNKINEILTRDYVSILFVIELINRFYFFKSVCLLEIFSEFKDSILSQTGFKQEQINLKRMKDNFRNIDQIVIPDVYDIFNEANENIIVMEYLDGKTVFEIDDLDKEEYTTIIFEMITKSILYDGVFHGDLHPGNIIFMKQDNGDKKIGLIDFGIIETITREEQYGFFKIATNVYLGYDECIKKIDEFLKIFIGPIDTLENMNVSDYSNLKDLITRDVIDNVFFTPSCFNINNLYKVNAIINNYGLSMNRNITKIIIAFVIVDRFCNKISPSKTYKSKINEVYELFDCLLLDDELSCYSE